jgi:hypothetical protein
LKEEAQIEIEQLKYRLYLAEMENTLLKNLNEIEGRNTSPKRDNNLVIQFHRLTTPDQLSFLFVTAEI